MPHDLARAAADQPTGRGLPRRLETFRDLDGTLRAVYSTFDETPGSPAAAIDAYRVLQLATVEAH